MPAIPDGWRDASWHNDTMPFFVASPERGVWVGYADESLREFGGGKRFSVVALVNGMYEPDDTPSILETDDWAEVLQFLAA
jgi:hypothetical protein